MMKENETKKCSKKGHEENDANEFCQECKIFMCNKCINFHSNLFNDHHVLKIDKNKNNIFTGLCQEENHLIKLEYFCKTHNVLCCSLCISKIKKKGNCQHSSCEVCTIEDICSVKKQKLIENIKTLEDLSSNLDNLINQTTEVILKVDKIKDELKLKIQNIFTRLRNALNDREDELIAKIDEKFNESIFKENFKKDLEKLPKNVKLYLEKGKAINNEWDENNIASLINDCSNIENNIKCIRNMQEEINKNINKKFDYNIKPEEEGIIKFIENIKNFSEIYDKNQSNFKPAKAQQVIKKAYGGLFG